MKRIVTSLAVLFTFACIISMSISTKGALAGLSDGLVAYYPFNGNAKASNARLSDDFNDNTINSLWWTSNIEGTGPTIAETNQRLEITLPSSSSDNPSSEVFYARYVSTWTLRGDFDIQVDYQLLVWPSTNGVRVGLVIGDKYAVERVSFGSSSDFSSYPDEVYTTDFNGNIHIVSTSDTSGNLRLVRSGSTLTGYYYNSSSGNWVSINSGSVTTADVSVSFSSWSHNYAFMDKEVKVAFDNFLVNQGQLIGLILISTVTTDSATNVTSNSATLNGTVNANGGTTTAWFEYGMTSGTYSNTTSSNTASGWSDTTISTDVSGLSSGTMYYYRAVAQNSEGAAYGSETSFTTLAPPEVVTGNATSITMISATLNGTVNAKGTSTTAWFEYGTVSGAYGNTTTQRSVSGSSDTSMSVYVSGLSSGTTYYYRLVAENVAGTAYGSEKSFATTSVTSPTPTPTQTPAPTQVPSPTPGTTPSPVISPTPVITPILTPSPLGMGIVFGYVYDEDENPLRSVTVNIDGDGYSDSGTTDEDGYYEFTDVPAGDYTITYTKKGYQAQTMDVTVEEGDAVQAESVVMPAVLKGTIYGYVTDIRGNPLESVKLKLAGIGMKAKKTASTDSDGFFEFTDLEAGRYRIVAKKRFYKAAQQTVELEEGEDKEIEIEMKKTTKRGLLMTEEIR